MSSKSIHKAIEDCIIPLAAKKLIISHQAALPENAHLWNPILLKINEVLLTEYFSVARKLRKSFEGIVNRIVDKVIYYMIKEDYKTTKGFICLILIGESRELQPAIQEVFDRFIGDIAGKLCREDYDKDLDNVLSSAKKQAPKVLAVVQKQGYFKG